MSASSSALKGPFLYIGHRDSLRMSELDMEKVADYDDCIIVKDFPNTERLPRKVSSDSLSDCKSATELKELLLATGLLFNRAKDKSQSFKERRM